MTARATSGPLTMSVERAELGKDETAFAVTIENTGDSEANLFNAIADATLTDNAGKTYFVRTLRTNLVDRIGAGGNVKGRLVFEPLPPSTRRAPLPLAALEIELPLRNASPAPIRIDPARFALFNDQGEQFAPLSAEQARQLIRNPALDLWGWFWFGTSGSEVGIGVGVTTRASQEVDLRILRAVDLAPGATLRGSVYFRSPHPQVNLFILSLDGLTGGADTPLAPARLTCDGPRAAATSGAAGAAKLVPLNARAAAGWSLNRCPSRRCSDPPG